MAKLWESTIEGMNFSEIRDVRFPGLHKMPSFPSFPLLFHTFKGPFKKNVTCKCDFLLYLKVKCKSTRLEVFCKDFVSFTVKYLRQIVLFSKVAGWL